MFYFWYVLFTVLDILLYGFDFLLLVRAVCSWVPNFRNSMVYNLSFAVTEPILKPVRRLFWKFDWARRLPIDMSFLAVCIGTVILERLLQRLYLLLIIL